MRECTWRRSAVIVILMFMMALVGLPAVRIVDTRAYAEDVESVQKDAGWYKQGKKKYFVLSDGQRAKGWQKIGRATYFFDEQGIMKTGWLKIGSDRYYLKKNGQRAKGWQKIGKKKYYFQKNGKCATGWKTIKGKDYLFSKKGVYTRTAMRKNNEWVGRDGKTIYPSTIKNLLKVALQPVGSTMYVWGGGWNVTQNGGDISARTIGVSPQWKAYFNQQTAAYDYTKTRFQAKNGLDCSGYIGWVIYNTFNKVSGQAGYVMLAQVQARNFASYGWGSYTGAGAVRDFKAGDIMSTSGGHVYIVVGQCADGSVVLLHSSPSGVMISGTSTRGGRSNSKAVKLARKYMQTYYPHWYAKYPKVERNASYVKNYSQMRWYLTDNIMSDPEGYTNKNAAQVLKDLFQ